MRGGVPWVALEGEGTDSVEYRAELGGTLLCSHWEHVVCPRGFPAAEDSPQIPFPQMEPHGHWAFPGEAGWQSGPLVLGGVPGW